jgi:hypothetical protein
VEAQVVLSIRLGNIGGGKTLLAVKDMALDSKTTFYSNIECKLPNVLLLKPEMIINEEVVGAKRSGEEICKYSANLEFWKKLKGKKVSVVLDEAHAIYNPRRSMSRINIAATDWLSMLRRVLGEDSRGSGDLVLITQLPNRIDVIARDMATNVRHHVLHYLKVCNSCGACWNENSEMPELRKVCPRCGSDELGMRNHWVEVWEFQSMQFYNGWKVFGLKTFFKHYYVQGVAKFFGLYNSWSWENLLSGFG